MSIGTTSERTNERTNDSDTSRSRDGCRDDRRVVPLHRVRCAPGREPSRRTFETRLTAVAPRSSSTGDQVQSVPVWPGRERRNLAATTAAASLPSVFFVPSFTVRLRLSFPFASSIAIVTRESGDNRDPPRMPGGSRQSELVERRACNQIRRCFKRKIPAGNGDGGKRRVRIARRSRRGSK